MPEYAKMKNVDLEALLKNRGLPTGGKKADMVERLTKDDEKKDDAPSALHPEDEIDWDDEVDDGSAEGIKPALTAPAAKDSEATASDVATETEAAKITGANGDGKLPKPNAELNQPSNTDLSTADYLAVKQRTEEDKKGATEAATADQKASAIDYTKGLTATNLEEEIEKRKRRAKKFGMKIDEDENFKKLMRAKKFGETGPPRGLDEALSEHQERRKRVRDDNDDGGRYKRHGGARFEDRRSHGGNRDGDRRRDDRDLQDRRERQREIDWMSNADRKKAEERKSKWAKPLART